MHINNNALALTCGMSTEQLSVKLVPTLHDVGYCYIVSLINPRMPMYGYICSHLSLNVCPSESSCNITSGIHVYLENLSLFRLIFIACYLAYPTRSK